MSHEILVTISQVGVTLAGFSGVVFALGNRAGRSLSEKEESGLTHMLLTSFGPVLISLVTLVLLSSAIDTESAWRLGCGIAGAYCFTGSTKAMIDEVKGRHSLPKLIAWVAPVGSQVLGAANLVIAFGYFTPYAAVALDAALIYLLWISISYFVSLLKQE